MLSQSEKTILVTGAAGFIGYHLSLRLLKQGMRIVGADCVNDYYDPSLKRARLAELAKYPNFTFLEGNLADEAFTARLFAKSKPAVVVHLGVEVPLASLEVGDAHELLGTKVKDHRYLLKNDTKGQSLRIIWLLSATGPSRGRGRGVPGSRRGR